MLPMTGFERGSSGPEATVRSLVQQLLPFDYVWHWLQTNTKSVFLPLYVPPADTVPVL